FLIGLACQSVVNGGEFRSCDAVRLCHQISTSQHLRKSSVLFIRVNNRVINRVSNRSNNRNSNRNSNRVNNRVNNRNRNSNRNNRFFCVVCRHLIRDRFVLRMSDDTYYHEACLQCNECGEPLSRHNACYKKDGRIYCRNDYLTKFSERCARCERVIAAQTDWVRRASTLVFHLACFSCDVCSQEMNQKTKQKRVRTTFSEEQLKILHQHFLLDSNPDGQDLDRIAKVTKLTKRVTQVWFQNSRARQKKHQQHIPSVGSDHSQGSEMHSDFHSYSAGSDHSDDWSQEEEDRLSGAGVTYMLE
ncbi:hypothetical protein BaRGS_00020658, partial [Batillaria attramentaria]